MTLIQFLRPERTGTIERVDTPFVRVSSVWGGGWMTVPYAFPISASIQTAPGIGRAQIAYDYGRIAREDSSSFSNFYPVDLSGYFAQIVAQRRTGLEILWTGVLDIDSVRIDGSSAHGPSGRQLFMGYEVGHLLDRVSLTCGRYVNGNVDPPMEAVGELGRLPEFNTKGRSGPSIVGNRTSLKFANTDSTGGLSESYVFGNAPGEEWSNLDIIEYLLTWHSPQFRWVVTGQFLPLAAIYEIHRLEGHTLWKALDELIDRKRGLGWTVRILNDGTLDLHVFSFLGSPLCFEDVIVPANAERLPDLQLDTDTSVSECTLQDSGHGMFDEIEVLGKPVRTCFTVNMSEGTLEKGWSDEDEAAYKALSELTNQFDSGRNDQERGSDKYKRVYQYFRIPYGWNGCVKAPDGVNYVPVFPKCFVSGQLILDEDNFVPTESQGGFIRDCRTLDRHLPIAKSWISLGEPEYLEPLVIFTAYNEDTVSFSAIQADAPGKARSNVRVSDRELGIWVEPQVNHILGRNHFPTYTEPGVAMFDQMPLVDYSTIYATVAVETDENLRVLVSSGSGGNRRLTIHADAECWYVVPGTFIAATGGEYVTHDGGVVLDESYRLRNMAALALAWYGQRRLALQTTWRKLTNIAPLGSYLDAVNVGWRRLAVGTVVTSIEWSFEGAPSTTLRTSYLDLDWLRDPPKIDRRLSQQDRRIGILENRAANLKDRVAPGNATGTVRGGDWLAWNEGGS